jgi:hypothetical protein
MPDTKWLKLRPSWELQNIVRALTYFEFLNTPEETERLQAAKAELRRRGKIRRGE